MRKGGANSPARGIAGFDCTAIVDFSWFRHLASVTRFNNHMEAAVSPFNLATPAIRLVRKIPSHHVGRLRLVN